MQAQAIHALVAEIYVEGTFYLVWHVVARSSIVYFLIFFETIVVFANGICTSSYLYELLLERACFSKSATVAARRDRARKSCYGMHARLHLFTFLCEDG